MLLFPIVFGLMAFLFTLIAIDAMFYKSVVEASPAGLSVRGGLLGLGRTRLFQPEEVFRFNSKQDMSSGKQVWRTITVETPSGKRTIGKSIPSKLAERAVIEELTAALGRDVPVVEKKSKFMNRT
jgi:hypothetical protein